MRLSTKGEYASRAMLELSLRYGQGALHVREISQAQMIPRRFLEQILLLLKRAGYLKSRKGHNGGFVLAKPPEAITVAEVIRVMDGPLAPIDCVSVMAHEPCPMEATCGLRWLWKDVRDAVAGMLERTTFADLVAKSAAPGGTTGARAGTTIVPDGSGNLMKEGKKMPKTIKRKLLKTAALALLAATLLPAAVRADETKDSPVTTALKSLQLSGYFQVEGVDWDKGVDTFSLRRARPTLSGEILKGLKFKVSVDLVKSPVLLDALVEFEPARALGVRVGQFLVPFSLESVTPTSDLDMVNRAAVVDTLVPGRDNGSSGRDIGAAFYGTYSIFEYTLGLFNGAGANKSDTNSHKDWGGRIVLRPLSFLAVGGSLYRGRQSATATDPLLKRDREGLEAAILYKRASLKGEYIHATDDLVSKSGWYVQGGFFALRAKLQALVRYDTLDPDRSVAGNAQNVIAFGVNWFIKGRTKLQVNYEVHTLEGGAHQKSGLLAQFQAGF
jgi:Rrf2 family protein